MGPRAILRALVALTVTFSLPVAAAERGYTVSDFDRIDVTGPFIVTVEVGKSPSARATGEARAIDGLVVEMRGRTLKIGSGSGGWGGWPGAKSAAPSIRVTVPALREAALRGSGKLAISKMRAQLVRVALSGSGTLSVSAIETDRLFANLLGSGTITMAGTALNAQVSTEGSGSIIAGGLKSTALTLSANSAGQTEMAVSKAATVQASGSGDVTITGSPACTVAKVGSGEVTCGTVAK
jgi:hypothetical protein